MDPDSGSNESSEEDGQVGEIDDVGLDEQRQEDDDPEDDEGEDDGESIVGEEDGTAMSQQVTGLIRYGRGPDRMSQGIRRRSTVSTPTKQRPRVRKTPVVHTTRAYKALPKTNRGGP